MSDDAPSALPHLAAAVGVGGTGRVLLALYGGERRPRTLVLEAMIGMLIGLIAASVAVWYDPSLRTLGFGLFIVSGVSGAASAIGTRILDMITKALQKRLGISDGEL